MPEKIPLAGARREPHRPNRFELIMRSHTPNGCWSSAVQPAPGNLIHALAYLVVLISEVARSFEPADDGPIARTDLAAVTLAIAVDEGHADPAFPIDDLGRDRLERPMMTHPCI